MTPGQLHDVEQRWRLQKRYTIIEMNWVMMEKQEELNGIIETIYEVRAMKDIKTNSITYPEQLFQSELDPLLKRSTQVLETGGID